MHSPRTREAYNSVYLYEFPWWSIRAGNDLTKYQAHWTKSFSPPSPPRSHRYLLRPSPPIGWHPLLRQRKWYGLRQRCCAARGRGDRRHLQVAKPRWKHKRQLEQNILVLNIVYSWTNKVGSTKGTRQTSWSNVKQSSFADYLDMIYHCVSWTYLHSYAPGSSLFSLQELVEAKACKFTWNHQI